MDGASAEAVFHTYLSTFKAQSRAYRKEMKDARRMLERLFDLETAVMVDEYENITCEPGAHLQIARARQIWVNAYREARDNVDDVAATVFPLWVIQGIPPEMIDILYT